MRNRVVKCLMGCLLVLAAVPAGAAPVEREVERWSLAEVWESIVAWATGGEVEPEPVPPPPTPQTSGPGEGDEDGGPEIDPNG